MTPHFPVRAFSFNRGGVMADRSWYLGGVDVRSYYRGSDQKPKFPWAFVLAVVAVGLVAFFWSASKAHAYTDDQIANAIYKAEGGSRTRHPYGILKKYKVTTPRQACINTIRHARRDWNGQGDFIAFLGSRYCPVGAANDPQGLNVNWIINVNYFLTRGE